MSHEKHQIPKENELPLDIKKSEKFKSPGMETNIYKTDVVGHSEEPGKTEKIILKEVKREDFDSLEEAEASKRFYEFLKSDPKFSKFVPSTLCFVARMNEGGSAKSYRLQRHIDGQTIDSIPDEELYKDKKLDEELLECVDGLIDIFEKQQEEKGDLPDLYGQKIVANTLFNPRHTTNLMIAGKPDEKGQRIFFVDTSKQSQGKSNKAIDWYQKNVGGPAQLLQLKRWREKILKEMYAKIEGGKEEGQLPQAAS